MNENYNETCMQVMYEMFLFYTGTSVFCLQGDTWNQRIFPFYSYTTLILLLHLLLIFILVICFA